MNLAGAVDAQPPLRRAGRWAAPAAVVLFATLTGVALVAGNGHLAVALTPIALAGAVMAALKVRLRTAGLICIYLVLGLESPGDASRQWESPLYFLGSVIHYNLNTTLPDVVDLIITPLQPRYLSTIRPLMFTGTDVILLILTGLLIFRRAQHSRIDPMPEVATARPVAHAVLVSLAAVILAWVWGLSRGGDRANSIWQVHMLVRYAPFFFLFQALFSGRRDYVLIGKVILAAAMVKASIAVWVRYTIFPNDEDSLPCTTSHGDSVLFTVACAIVFALLLEKPNARHAKLALFTLPLLFWGMIANARRLVWAELVFIAVVFLLMSGRSRLRRLIMRAAVLAAPVFLLYVAAGWNQSGGVFAPVRTIRSMVDSDVDDSTSWRDVENYNLIRTFRDHQLLGTGFGHEYVEFIGVEDISGIFGQYRYIPHNNVLSMWAFTGLVGFSGIWMMVVVGGYFASRSYRLSRDPLDRSAALVSVGTLLVFGLHAYGDMGIVEWQSLFTVVPALVVASKLATISGAWPSRRGRARAAEATPAAGAPA